MTPIESMRAVGRALRQRSPVVVDVPPGIRKLLVRRYLAMSLANGRLAPIPFLLASIAVAYEAPLGAWLLVWCVFVAVCLIREWRGRRLLRRLDAGEDRSDPVYNLLVVIGTSFWGFGPLLLSLGPVSEVNFFTSIYIGLFVVALTSIGYLSALPACYTTLVFSVVPLVVCLALHGTRQTAVVGVLSLVGGLVLLQRILAAHDILLGALAAEAQNAALVAELQRYRNALERENATLGSSLRDASHAASRDALTNLYNRRYFAAFAEPLAEAVRAHREEVTICIIDVDHFKRVNDAHGHPVGDEVLRFIAVLLGARLRDFDCLARYGGEEFAIILRRCDIARGRRVAEALRHNVAGADVETDAGTLMVTISVGVAQWASGEVLDEVVQRADRALYRAKESGRDRVEIDGRDALRALSSTGVDSTFPANLH